MGMVPAHLLSVVCHLNRRVDDESAIAGGQLSRHRPESRNRAGAEDQRHRGKQGLGQHDG